MGIDNRSNDYHLEEYLEAAYEAGYTAYSNDYSLGDCPTYMPSVEQQCWRNGWKAAERDYSDEQ